MHGSLNRYKSCSLCTFDSQFIGWRSISRKAKNMQVQCPSYSSHFQRENQHWDPNRNPTKYVNSSPRQIVIFLERDTEPKWTCHPILGLHGKKSTKRKNLTSEVFSYHFLFIKTLKVLNLCYNEGIFNNSHFSSSHSLLSLTLLHLKIYLNLYDIVFLYNCHPSVS